MRVVLAVVLLLGGCDVNLDLIVPTRSPSPPLATNPPPRATPRATLPPPKPKPSSILPPIVPPIPVPSPSLCLLPLPVVC